MSFRFLTKISFSLSLLFLFSAGATWAEPHSLPPWKIERSKAISLDNAHNYSRALESYLRALALLPAEALSDKVDLQCQIAIEYMRLHDKLKANRLIDEILSHVQKLQKSKTFSADGEMSVRGLMEEVENSIKGNLNIKTWTERITLEDKICTIALPQAKNFPRYSDDARTYLALGSPVLALNCAENYFKRMTPHSENYFDFKIRIAALKNYLKQPAMLKEVRSQLLKVKSPVAVAAEIGRAQTWATDYGGCDRGLAEAFTRYTSGKNASEEDILLLSGAQISNWLDCGSWAKGEQLCRKCLKLKLSESLRTHYINALAECLSRQGKNQEANALKNKSRSQFNFLAEDELEAAEESRRRRARNGK